MNQVYICADFGSDGAENIKRATYSGALNLSKPKDLHRMGETRKCKLWNGSELWVFGDRTTPEMREEIRSFQAINGANARVRYVSDAELERYYNRRPCGRKFRRK